MRWLNRPIAADIRYLVLDGMYVSVKRDSARKEALLAAVGITESVANALPCFKRAMPAALGILSHFSLPWGRLGVATHFYLDLSRVPST